MNRILRIVICALMVLMLSLMNSVVSAEQKLVFEANDYEVYDNWTNNNKNIPLQIANIC